jgi:LPPG:FO 2-phospho-L-lactate transferase
VIAVLAGGVGAARLLRGVIEAVDPGTVTAIVNTGDDTLLHGLTICPDLDTVTYTLADAIDRERGWGLSGETWRAMAALGRFEPVRPAGSGAAATWFNLGDADLATHLYRSHRLAEGAPLSTVTDEIRRAFGVGLRLVPMSDDRVETRIVIAGEGEVGFQEYFVGRHHSVPVTGVRFVGAEVARPGPGVLDALRDADVVIVAPSNPIVSIGPILAVPGIGDALRARRDTVAAVSPIVGGRAVKGPADRMLRELGGEASVVEVARRYRDVAGTLVVDEADRHLAADVEAEGVRCIVAPTMMTSPAIAAELTWTIRRAITRGQAGGAT